MIQTGRGNIFLIGGVASGKRSLGLWVTQQLGVPYFDMDREFRIRRKLVGSLVEYSQEHPPEEVADDMMLLLLDLMREEPSAVITITPKLVRRARFWAEVKSKGVPIHIFTMPGMAYEWLQGREFIRTNRDESNRNLMNSPFYKRRMFYCYLRVYSFLQGCEHTIYMTGDREDDTNSLSQKICAIREYQQQTKSRLL